MAKLVPEDVATTGGGAGMAASTVAEDEDAGGCGSANGKTSGGEMTQMEEMLLQDEKSTALEVEINSKNVPGQRHDRNSTRKLRNVPSGTSKHQDHDRDIEDDGTKSKQPPVRMSRRTRTQQLGQCSRCGYLSSQAICKACMLLEGLNKNRPKMQIEVGVDDEDGSLSLRRRMEGVALSGG